MSGTLPAEVPDLYQRMRLIPTWDYGRCADLDIALVGCGGLGSVILQQLCLLGIGERGVLTIVDDDVIEPSNRARIPYATARDDGARKVDIAERYVAAVRPDRAVRTMATDVFNRQAQERVAASDVIIGAVDSELARVAMNHLAYAFCLPYLDAGAGIIVTPYAATTLVHSGGQVRLVIPGMTPCLLCNVGIDRNLADIEWLRRRCDADALEKHTLDHSGYIRGLAAAAPQPSAAHLNFAVASGLVTILIETLLAGAPTCQAFHLDLAALEWTRTEARTREHCAVCGTGSIGNGEFFSLEALEVPITLSPTAALDAPH